MSSARKELYATIEEQNTKIRIYEAKISDLIKAYKSLSREKKALQLSLEAVTCNPPEQEHSEKNTDNHKENLESSGDIGSQETQNSDGVSEIIKLQRKVTTLTTALQTLTAEKNLTESSLREDRKRILEERKKIEEQLKSATDESIRLKVEYDSKLQDFKTRLIVSQHEREQEMSNGAVMLREVESRLSKERNDRERIEKQMDELKEQNRQFSLALDTKNQEKKQQKQITDLQNELEQVRCRLKKAEQQCQEPPILKKLNDQMIEMKSQYTTAILQEQLRAEAAENSAKELSQIHEERVAALESNLTELSFSAANYDRAKQTHLQTIHSLKEKIAELSEANIFLSVENNSKSSIATVNSKCNDGNINLAETFSKEAGTGEYNDFKSLIDKFIIMWDQIQNGLKYDTDCCIEELLLNNEIIHKNCIYKYNELKKEFEGSKAGTTLDATGNNFCTCGLKDQLDETRERIRSLNLASHTTQIHHNRQVVTLNEDIKHLHLKYEEQVQQLLQDHKASISNLEQQLAEHCQRSLITLQDRDEEIHRLIQEIHKLNKEAQLQPSTVAAALLSQVSSGGTDGPLLHHLEELARKELEVSKLRKEKILLERSMREIQMNSIDKQQLMQETIDDLTEQVERLKRNTSREGENLEYLKNIVLQYMTSCEIESRQVILNAIAAVLKFTPQEIESVKKCLALWWWQASPPKNKTQGHKIARSPSVSSSSGISSNFVSPVSRSTRGRYPSNAL